MSVHALALTLLAAFLFVRLLLAPKLGASVDRIRTPGHAGKVALASALVFASNALFWGLIATMLVALAEVAINATGGVTAAAALAAKARLAEAQGLLGFINSGLALMAAAVVALGVSYWTYRSVKAAGERELDNAYQAEIERLLEDGARGELPDLPPTEAMLEVERRIEEVIAILAQASPDESGTVAVDLRPEQRGALETRAKELRELWHVLDLRRRATPAVDPAELGLRKPSGRFAWLASVFISEGLVRTVSGAQRVLAVAMSLLLIPAMLSLSSPWVEAEAAAGQERLAKLAFELHAKELAADVDQAFKDATRLPLARPDAAEAETVDDVKTARVLAHLFEARVLPEALTGRLAAPVASADFQLVRRAKARDAVLAVAQRSVVGAAEPNVEGLLREATPENVALELLERSGPDRPPVTGRGRVIEERLLALAKEQPAYFARARQLAGDYLRSFGRVARPETLRALMVTQMLGQAGDATALEGRMGTLASEALINVSTETTEKFIETEYQRFILEIARSDDLDAAVRAAVDRRAPAFSPEDWARFRSAADELPDHASIARAASHRPPSFEPPPDPSFNVQAAQATVREMAEKIHDGQPPAVIADALASYADYFPEAAGADGRTARAQAMRGLGFTVPESSAAAQASFQRARSYVSLRGFARVGGVLFGRLPEGPRQPLSIDELQWRLEDRGLFMNLRPTGADRVELGPFHAGIAHLALAYAADGRPTTVTMVEAPPLEELRILLHPVLLNTPLGCRMTRLDQFADEFTSSSVELGEVRRAETLAAIDLMSLYDLAWAVRADRLLAPAAGAHQPLPARLSEDLRPFVAGKLENVELRDGAGRALATGPDLPALERKPAFFDERLVKDMQACQVTNGLETFSACVADRASASTAYRIDRGLWTTPPPLFNVWSGVRERAYQLDPSFAFARADPPDPIDPVEFVVQIAFKSPPYLADLSHRWFEEEAASQDGYVDVAPWELPATGMVLQETMRTSLGEEHAAIMRDVQEFVVAQRLFRLALDGYFGDGFPIERLREIAEATARLAPEGARTLRWNVRTGALEHNFYSRLQSALDNPEIVLSKPQRERAEACRGWVESVAANGVELAAAPSDVWASHCELAQPSALAKISEETILRRTLRAQLGVNVDDQQAAQRQSGRSCPPAR